MKAYGSDPACLDKKNDENLFGLPREMIQPFSMVPFLTWCCSGEPPVMKVALFLQKLWPFLFEKFPWTFPPNFLSAILLWKTCMTVFFVWKKYDGNNV